MLAAFERALIPVSGVLTRGHGHGHVTTEQRLGRCIHKPRSAGSPARAGSSVTPLLRQRGVDLQPTEQGAHPSPQLEPPAVETLCNSPGRIPSSCPGSRHRDHVHRPVDVSTNRQPCGRRSNLPPASSEDWQPPDTAPQTPRTHGGATPHGSHAVSVRKTLGITRGPCSTPPRSDTVTSAHSLVPRPRPPSKGPGSAGELRLSGEHPDDPQHG